MQRPVSAFVKLVSALTSFVADLMFLVILSTFIPTTPFFDISSARTSMRRKAYKLTPEGDRERPMPSPELPPFERHPPYSNYK